VNDVGVAEFAAFPRFVTFSEKRQLATKSIPACAIYHLDVDFAVNVLLKLALRAI